MSNIYYKTNLTFKKQIELMKYAYSICENWIYEELDCSKSYLRKKVDKNFEDALSIFKKHKTHFCVIFRDVIEDDNKYLEISMTDFEAPSHFLSINLNQSYIPEICKDFET